MDLSPALEATPASERPRIDRAAGALVGSHCTNCGANSWPGRSVCHRCGSADLERRTFGREGVLASHTTCWVKRPGLEPPFTLGQVRLDDGLKVFGHIRGDAEIAVGARVATVIAPEGAVPEFWFETIEEEGKA